MWALIAAIDLFPTSICCCYQLKMNCHLFPPANVVLIVLACATLVLTAKKKTKVRTTAIVDEVGTCGEMNPKDMFVNFTYAGKDDFRIYFEFTAEKPVDNLSYVNSFERCETSTAVQCEPFMDVPIDDYCPFLQKEPRSIWKIILGSFEPKLACPLMGKYVMRNLVVTDVVEGLVKIASVDVKNDRYYYRWTMKATDKAMNKDVFCLWAIGSLKQFRVSQPSE